MSRTKKHLIAGAVIGGLLLAATMQPGTSFALSETPSTTTDTSTNKPQQPTLPTLPDEPGSTPSQSSTDATAGGSTATQSSDTNVSSTSTTNATTSQPAQPILPSDPSSPTTPITPDSTTATQANDTTVKNTVDGTAKTGNAKVKDGAVGGDATTGSAGDTTTLINAIASSSSLNSGSLQTFTYNVNGTHNGDILINPSNLLTSSSTTAPSSCPTPTADTAVNNTTLTNLVNLLATSGNATVSNNGVGGNATSGNATTEADIINLIEALISDKQSFLGVVNVNGNLNGNILLPASAIDSLLTPTQGTAAGNATATNNINVNNQINLSATSGTATVVGNGNGGNATSGNAKTILNTCNLVNSNIVGGNVLLVFMNVMGHWYGLLMNAPAGTTNAVLGGGISQDVSVPASQVTAINNETVNNIVNLTSITGNATVMNNGVGGNATTGNASAVADVVNILGSQINLSGWLGILVINVFGTWNGSLAIQPTSTTYTGNGSGSNTHRQSVNNANVSDPAGSDGYTYYIAYPSGTGQNDPFTLTSAHIMGASTTSHDLQNVASGSKHVADSLQHDTQSGKSLLTDFVVAGIGAVLAITGGLSKFFANRHKQGRM